MDIPPTPNITSFVIRFVHQDPGHAGSSLQACRGTIHHIQTDEEIAFSNWNDAVSFIQRFVPVIPESDRETGNG